MRRNKTIILRFVKLKLSLKNFKCMKKNFENGKIQKIMKKKFLALCFIWPYYGTLSDPLGTIFKVILVIFMSNKSGLGFLIKWKINFFSSQNILFSEMQILRSVKTLALQSARYFYIYIYIYITSTYTKNNLYYRCVQNSLSLPLCTTYRWVHINFFQNLFDCLLSFKLCINIHKIVPLKL